MSQETKLSEPPETLRLHQANERTLLAWIRTGIALMAFGFAIARFGVFLRQVQLLSHGAAPKSIGSTYVGAALVALGMATNLVATLRYGMVRGRIVRGELGAPPTAAVYALGITLTAVGLVMALLLLRSLEG